LYKKRKQIKKINDSKLVVKKIHAKIMKLCSTFVFGLKSFYVLNFTSTEKSLLSCVHALWNESALQAEGPTIAHSSSAVAGRNSLSEAKWQ
jgi:hypothetical protein